LVLERFPAHWRAAEYRIDRLVFRPMPDSTVRLLNLRSGSLDLIERLGPNDVAATERDPGFAVQAATGLGYYNLTFNMAGAGANPAVAHTPAVRQALDLALDRNAINQVAFAGRAEPGNQPFPPDSPWFDRSRPVPARDLAAAKAKLAGIGPVTLDLLVPTDPERQQVGQMIQAMAAEAGITVHLGSMELISLLDRGKRGDFQAYLVGWSGRPDPDLNITPMLSCGAAGNDGRYCSPALDAALAEGRATADPARRRAAYDKAVEVLLTDRPTLYLYHAKWIFAHAAALHGFKAYADGIIRVDGVTLDR
jgi:peptide/nickel transport system substrate-binding protein